MTEMKNDWPRLGRMVSSEGFETGRAIAGILPDNGPGRFQFSGSLRGDEIGVFFFVGKQELSSLFGRKSVAYFLAIVHCILRAASDEEFDFRW